MKNPLSSKYSEEKNKALVSRIREQGDRTAMDELIHLHQPFIYNVAWKMTRDHNDAMDLTQDTLLIIITKLSQFNFNSSFRTWLYRIVVNEFLQKERKKKAVHYNSFEDYGNLLDSIPNAELSIEEKISYKELTEEMRFGCMMGMLMCLTKEQRLIYILGDTFGINHNLGGDIFEITPQNFRIKLHRARKDLYNFMNKKCGLVNKDNPCRCPKKTKTLEQNGALDSQNMVFNVKFKNKVADYVEEHVEQADESFDEQYTSLYRDHPFKEDFDKETVMTKILNNVDLMRHFQ
ncbi:MAG: sigma-70 family RNA polymerase sigma factor [Bacteroidota bacterium]